MRKQMGLRQREYYTRQWPDPSNLRRDHEDERGYDSRYQTFRMCPGAMTLIDSDMGTYSESLTNYGQEKTVPVLYPSGLPIHDAN